MHQKVQSELSVNNILKFFLEYKISRVAMANQSAKKNQQKIKTPVQILTYLVYGVTVWFALWNIYYLLYGQVSIWHFLMVSAVAYLNHFCLKSIVKCWQLQISEAAEYYIDILVMNCVVAIFDFWTHKIWHVYWLILIFALSHAVKWLWAYITPKYEENSQAQSADQGKKGKKQKKQKVKYVKH